MTRSNARSIIRRKGAPNKRTRTRFQLVGGGNEIKVVRRPYFGSIRGHVLAANAAQREGGVLYTVEDFNLGLFHTISCGKIAGPQY